MTFLLFPLFTYSFQKPFIEEGTIPQQHRLILKSQEGKHNRKLKQINRKEKELKIKNAERMEIKQQLLKKN